MIFVFLWLLICNTVLIDPRWAGDVTAFFYAVQLIGWVGIAAYGLLRGSKPIIPLLLWAWVFFISQPASFITLVELTRLLGFIGLYSLNFDIDKARRMAGWVLPVVLVWSVFGQTLIPGHRNDYSMMIWVVLMVSNRRGWWVAIAGAIMLYLGSEAALISLLLGVMVERWGYKTIIPALSAMLILGAARGMDSSTGFRIRMWVHAVSAFNFLGNGIPYTYNHYEYNYGWPKYIPYGYAHSLPVDVLYIAGLPGLGLLGVASWWLWRNRAQFGPWGGFIAGFAVYSLVDYPQWSIPGAVLMIILSKYRKDQTNYGFTLGRWLRLYFLARRGYGVGVQRGAGVASVTDSHRTR